MKDAVKIRVSIAVIAKAGLHGTRNVVSFLSSP